MRNRNITPGLAMILTILLFSSCTVIQGIVQVGFGFIMFVVIEIFLIISALVIRLEGK